MAQFFGLNVHEKVFGAVSSQLITWIEYCMAAASSVSATKLLPEHFRRTLDRPRRSRPLHKLNVLVHVELFSKRLLKFVVFRGLGQLRENLYQLIPSAVEVSEFLEHDFA